MAASLMFVELRYRSNQATKLQRLCLRFQQLRYGYATESFRYTKDITHSISIPLANPVSRAQLDRSRKRLMRDRVTETVPTEAFVRPASQSIGIANISLDAKDRWEYAREILQTLDLETMLQQSRESCWPAVDTDSGEKADRSIRASVVGLKGGHQNLSAIKRLYAPVIDPEDVLPEFLFRIRESLHQAGLLRTHQPNREKLPVHVKIIDTHMLHTSDLINYSDYRDRPGPMPKTLSLDLRSLYEKYKDFPWAENIQLQRISISEVRLQYFRRRGIIFDQGYREIASVPLPGASHVDPAADQYGVDFQPAWPMRGFRPGTIYDVDERG